MPILASARWTGGRTNTPQARRCPSHQTPAQTRSALQSLQRQRRAQQTVSTRQGSILRESRNRLTGTHACSFAYSFVLPASHHYTKAAESFTLLLILRHLHIEPVNPTSHRTAPLCWEAFFLECLSARLRRQGSNVTASPRPHLGVRLHLHTLSAADLPAFWAVPGTFPAWCDVQFGDTAACG